MSGPASLSSQRSFWPVGEAAQADYEALRSHVRATGSLPDSITVARFSRRGLAGLIAWPSWEPIFQGKFTGGIRPAWTPQVGPRLEILAEGFALLLKTGGAGDSEAVTGTEQRRRSRR